MKPVSRVFFVLALAGFLFGHLGRYLWPGLIVGRINPLDLLVFVTVVILAVRSPRAKISPLLLGAIILIAFSVWQGIALFGMASQWEALLYTVRLVAYLYLIGLAPAVTGFDGWRLAEWIGTILAVVGFIQLRLFPSIPMSFVTLYGFDPHSGRLFATFFDPNLLASILIITAILTFARFYRRRYWFDLVALAVQLLALLATQSRSGLLGLLVAVVVLVAAVRPRWLLVGIAGSMAVLFLSSTLWQRVMGGVTLDATSQARFASWNTAAAVITINPITGVGYNFYQAATTLLGRFTPHVGQVALAANASDSSLLTIWATAGIFGLVLFVAWLLSLCNLTGTTPQRVTLRAVIVGILVNSLFINTLLYPFVLFLMALAVIPNNEPA